jgi:hypothetical protein
VTAECFSCSLDVLYGGLNCNSRKKIYFILSCEFFNFWSSKHWIRIRFWIWIGTLFTIQLNCWIRILWIRIRKTCTFLTTDHAVYNRTAISSIKIFRGHDCVDNSSPCFGSRGDARFDLHLLPPMHCILLRWSSEISQHQPTKFS